MWGTSRDVGSLPSPVRELISGHGGMIAFGIRVYYYVRWRSQVVWTSKIIGSPSARRPVRLSGKDPIIRQALALEVLGHPAAEFPLARHSRDWRPIARALRRAGLEIPEKFWAVNWKWTTARDLKGGVLISRPPDVWIGTPDGWWRFTGPVDQLPDDAEKAVVLAGVSEEFRRLRREAPWDSIGSS